MGDFFLLFSKNSHLNYLLLITTNRCGYLKVTVNYHHRGEYTLAVAVHAVLTVFVLFSLDFGSLFLSLMQLSIIFFFYLKYPSRFGCKFLEPISRVRGFIL